MPLLHGAEHSATRVVWQVPGRAHRIPAEAFVALAREGRSGCTLDLYQQELFEQMAQVAGCTRRHTFGQRPARWLLMTHDRVDGDEFGLTHESLATRLGPERPKVTLVASSSAVGASSVPTEPRPRPRRPGLEVASWCGPAEDPGHPAADRRP